MDSFTNVGPNGFPQPPPQPPRKYKDVPKKDVPCPYEDCDMMFTCQHNVDQHIREAHTKERPFVCEFCEVDGKISAFTRPGTLNRHYRLVHKLDKKVNAGRPRKRMTRKVVGQNTAAPKKVVPQPMLTAGPAPAVGPQYPVQCWYDCGTQLFSQEHAEGHVKLAHFDANLMRQLQAELGNTQPAPTQAPTDLSYQQQRQYSDLRQLANGLHQQAFGQQLQQPTHPQQQQQPLVPFQQQRRYNWVQQQHVFPHELQQLNQQIGQQQQAATSCQLQYEVPQQQSQHQVGPPGLHVANPFRPPPQLAQQPLQQVQQPFRPVQQPFQAPEYQQQHAAPQQPEQAQQPLQHIPQPLQQLPNQHAPNAQQPSQSPQRPALTPPSEVLFTNEDPSNSWVNDYFPELSGYQNESLLPTEMDGLFEGEDADMSWFDD